MSFGGRLVGSTKLTGWKDTRSVERAISKYVSATSEVMMSSDIFSIACDERRVCAKAVTHGCIVWPGKRAMWCAPQAPKGAKRFR